MKPQPVTDRGPQHPNVIPAVPSEFVRVGPDSPVRWVVAQMRFHSARIAFVERESRIQGVFTASDFLDRVYLKGKDPNLTPVREVMTSKLNAITEEMTLQERDCLLEGTPFQRIPVLDRNGRATAVIRPVELARKQVRELLGQNEVLVAYICTDGIGGD